MNTGTCKVLLFADIYTKMHGNIIKYIADQ